MHIHLFKYVDNLSGLWRWTKLDKGLSRAWKVRPIRHTTCSKVSSRSRYSNKIRFLLWPINNTCKIWFLYFWTCQSDETWKLFQTNSNVRLLGYVFVFFMSFFVETTKTIRCSEDLNIGFSMLGTIFWTIYQPNESMILNRLISFPSTLSF